MLHPGRFVTAESHGLVYRQDPEALVSNDRKVHSQSCLIRVVITIEVLPIVCLLTAPALIPIVVPALEVRGEPTTVSSLSAYQSLG